MSDTKKICIACGKENIGNAKFCAKCGELFENKEVMDDITAPEENNNSKGIKKHTIIFMFLIILLLIVVIVVALRIRSKNYYVGKEVQKGKVIGQDYVWLRKSEETFTCGDYRRYYTDVQIEYKYDNVGNLIELTENEFRYAHICYEYDKTGKIFREYFIDTNEYLERKDYIPQKYYEYIYDSNGYLKAKKLVKLSYSFGGLIKKEVEAPYSLPTFTYECDDAGNITREVEYEQDTRNILHVTINKYLNNTLIEKYEYDSNELLVSKTIFEYDSEGRIVASYDYFVGEDVGISDSLDNREWYLFAYVLYEYDANNNLSKKSFYDVKLHSYDDEDYLFKYIEYLYELTTVDIIEFR